MAGDVNYHRRSLACCIATEVETELGFWVFLLSNVLWIVWGFVDSVYALIVLQISLAFMNIRGAMKNQS